MKGQTGKKQTMRKSWKSKGKETRRIKTMKNDGKENSNVYCDLSTALVDD